MLKKNKGIVLIVLMLLSISLKAQTETPDQNSSNVQDTISKAQIEAPDQNTVNVQDTISKAKTEAPDQNTVNVQDTISKAQTEALDQNTGNVQDTIVAPEGEVVEHTITIDSTVLLITKPKKNWFWGFSVGAHTFIGNELEPSARLNPIAPHVGLRIGKWLTPFVSLTLNVDGGYAKSQSKSNVYVYQAGEYKSFTFYYYDLYAEVTLDWMDLFLGYDKAEKKIYHLQNALGFGYGWQTGKSTDPRQSVVSNYELSFHFSFNNEFKLKNSNVIFLEPKFMLLRGSWDYSPYSNDVSRFDYMVSLSAGMKFNISGVNNKYHNFEHGKLEYEKVVLKPECDNAKIDSLNKVIVDLLCDDAATPQAVIDMAEVKCLDILTIYYKIDRYNIDHSSEVSLENFARIIKESPEDRKYCIISSADSPTGTPEHNVVLSHNRSEACYKRLVEKYGVNPEKLEVYSIGGILYYKPDYMNRMTIIVEKDAEIVNILRNLKAGE